MTLQSWRRSILNSLRTRKAGRIILSSWTNKTSRIARSRNGPCPITNYPGYQSNLATVTATALPS